MSKRELQEKDLKTILAKDIGAKNPIFSADHIAELHAVFSLYADPRQRRADVRDILLTASTLGLDAKYEFVFRLIHENRIFNSTQGSPFSEEGRKANFTLLDVEGKGELNIADLKYINEQLKYGYNEDQLW